MGKKIKDLLQEFKKITSTTDIWSDLSFHCLA